MKGNRRLLIAVVFAFAFAWAASMIWAATQGQALAKKAPIKLPPAVAKAVQGNRPGAEIDKLTVEREGGVALYDIEFKAGKGEIEVAEDGTVLDVSTIIEMMDIPKAAAETIRKAAVGSKIKQLEKSEVRAELKMEGKVGKIVKLAAPTYVYEAELVKGDQTGEIQVALDGKIVEALKWGGEEAKEVSAKGEKQEKAKPVKKN